MHIKSQISGGKIHLLAYFKRWKLEECDTVEEHETVCAVNYNSMINIYIFLRNIITIIRRLGYVQPDLCILNKAMYFGQSYKCWYGKMIL